jgi:hypothetical protein
MAKPKNSGLTKWFKEDWRDVKTGKKCGRSGAKKKTGPKMVKWSVTASGRKRKTTKPRKRIA